MKPGGTVVETREKREAAGRKGGGTGGRASREHRGKVAAGNPRLCRTGETSGPTTRGFTGEARGSLFTFNTLFPVADGEAHVLLAPCICPSPSYTCSPNPASRTPTSEAARSASLRARRREHGRGCGAPGLQETIKPASRPAPLLPPKAEGSRRRRPGQPCPPSEVTRGSVVPG